MVVKAFRVVDGELVEVDFSYRDVVDSLGELSESLNGFGESSLTIVSGFDDLSKSMRNKLSPREQWRGEGKRKMRVNK